MFTRFELTAMGKRSDVEIVSLDREVISCGRDVDNDVLIDSDSVSRRHAYFISANGEWVFVDAESTNRSCVNEDPVLPGRFYPLRHGDVVQLADVKLRFALKDGASSRPKKQSLLIFAGESFEREVIFPAVESEFVIGATSGDLVLDEPTFENETVVIKLEAKGFELDARSTAMRVLVNGNEVTGRVELVDRCSITVGLYSIVVIDDEHAKLPPQSVIAPESDEEGVGAIFDKSMKRAADKVSVRDWEEEEADNPFTDREASFKQTITMKARPGSGFGKLAEDDPYSSFSSLRKPRNEEEETNPMQIVLGVVLIISIVIGLFYVFFI